MRFAEAVLDRIHARESLVGAWVLNEWANLDYEQADFAASARAGRAAIALKARFLGPEHPDVAGSMSNLADTLEEEGRWDEALVMAQQGLAIDEKSADTHSISFAVDLMTVGEILAHRGRLDDAEAALRRALAVAADAGGRETMMFGVALTDLGELLISRGRPREAVAVLDRAQSNQAETGDENVVRVAATRAALARALIESGQRRPVAFQLLAGRLHGVRKLRLFPARARAAGLVQHASAPREGPACDVVRRFARPARSALSYPTSTRASAARRRWSRRGRSSAVTGSRAV